MCKSVYRPRLFASTICVAVPFRLLSTPFDRKGRIAGGEVGIGSAARLGPWCFLPSNEWRCRPRSSPNRSRSCRILPEGAVERGRVGTRQHGQRAQPLGPSDRRCPTKDCQLSRTRRGENGTRHARARRLWPWRRQSTRRYCSWRALSGPAVRRVRSRADLPASASATVCASQ